MRYKFSSMDHIVNWRHPETANLRQISVIFTVVFSRWQHYIRPTFLYLTMVGNSSFLS